MKTVEQLIEFCESKGYGFSIARSSGGVRYTVFIHTTIMDEIEFDTISKFSQSLYLDDAIGMTIEKVKLIKVNI